MIVCKCIPLTLVTIYRWRYSCFIAMCICFVMNMSRLSALLCLPLLISYMVSLINLNTGPWGSSEGRLWCDVYSMICGGYDTLYGVAYVLYVSAAFSWCLHVVEMPISFCLIIFVLTMLIMAGKEYKIHYMEPRVSDEIRIKTLGELHLIQIQEQIEIPNHTNAVIVTVLLYIFMTGVMLSYVGTHDHHTVGFGIGFIALLNDFWGSFILYFIKVKRMMTPIQVLVTRDLISISILLIIMSGLRYDSLQAI